MFIQGNLFKSLARFIYAPRRGPNDNPDRFSINNIRFGDYRYLVNTLDSRLLSDGDKIYTHTFYADQLAEYLSGIEKRVYVITHNSDAPMDFVPPENVIKWYSTNVNIRDERVVSIPIGIENEIWLKDKRYKLIKKLDSPRKFRNLVYMNHNIKTNPEKRRPPYEILSGYSWVTKSMGSNGQGFDNYLDNIYNHPFVVCPEGNGIDTHRVWECLYVGSIPIQIRNINNGFYHELPILFIDDWGELNEKFLADAYSRIAERKWDKKILSFEYWREYINARR